MEENKKRAERARNAIQEAYGDQEELEVLARDFLADLMHLCRAKGIDFEDALEMGKIHFEAELKEEA